MSASNKGPNVDPRLQNLTNALYLDGNDDVVIRTGIAGDIIITGNVNVPGTVVVDSTPDNPVHVHVTELPPITGNVNANVTGTVSVNNFPTSTTITSGNVNANVTGNVGVTGTVNIGTMPEVEIKNDSGNAIPVTGNVNVTNITSIPVIVNPKPITGFYTFNNFGVNSNRGWTLQNNEIPMFAVRVKPSSGKSFRLINYDIGNNNANQSTIGYTWYNAPTITGPAWSWVDIGTTGIQYAVFNDCYGSNTPNGLTGGTLNHSGVMIGKTNSQMTPEMVDAVFTDGGMTMVCAVRRMDNATKIDVWFGVTMVTLT